MDLSGPITAILRCQVVWEYIDVYYAPCVDVVWLGPPAFLEELVKSSTYHNFADPILHNIVVKYIFAWVYLVSTDQITNQVSLEIIGIGNNSSEMDRDRYSGNCLFKVEACNGEEEEEQKKVWCGGGVPHTARSIKYSERR